MSAVKTSRKEFIRQMEALRERIRHDVTPFENDTPEKKAARIERARTDKLYFAKTYFPHYIQDRFSWIHKLMFKLADVINIPVILAAFRGAAKSVIISLIDPIHKIVYELRWFIILLGETEGVAEEFSGPLREELEYNERLRHDFGEMKKDGTWEWADFTTKNGRRVLARGRKQKVKGLRNGPHRPDHVICEEYEDMYTSYNPVIVEKGVKKIIQDVLFGVDPKGYSFIFHGNLFSKTSVMHTLLKKLNWVSEIIPAEKDGRSNWPSRYPMTLLRQMKKVLGSKAYDVEMMQIPRDDVDGTFRDKWFDRCKYVPEDLKGKKLRVVMYNDPAIGKGRSHSYKAIIVLAQEKTDLPEMPFIYYVLSAWIRKKASLMEMGRVAYQLDEEFSPFAFGIEDVAFQAALKDLFNTLEVQYGRHIPIKMVKLPPKLSKEDRIARRSPMIERGIIKFLPSEGDQDELIRQFLQFDNRTVELDGPDALDGAIRMFEGPKKKRIRSIGASSAA